jgi:phage RecT family recombinase
MPNGDIQDHIQDLSVANINCIKEEDVFAEENQHDVVSKALVQQEQTAMLKSIKPRDGIYELCNARKEKLLPFLNNNNMHFEKLARSFAWEININDKLKSCSQISMVEAFYKCCEYGLNPAKSLGQAWMIPYNGKIDFQIGYRGWLKILFNNPIVSNVYSYNVYENDQFDYELGMNPNIKHIPAKGKQTKDDLVASYGVVKLKNGEAQIRVCLRDEIDESMAVSRGSYKAESPWKTNFEAMSLVVPIRKMGNNLGLPLRIEEYDEELKITTQLENIKNKEIA